MSSNSTGGPTPGEPAMILLWALVGVGLLSYGLMYFIHSRKAAEPSNSDGIVTTSGFGAIKYTVYFQSGFYILLAFPFWIWSFVNAAANGFDFGCISFAAVIGTALNALVWGRNTPKKSARYLAAACFLVAVNYIGGMFIVGGSNGVVLGYFAAAALVWIAAGSWVASSGNKLEQLEQGSRPGHGGRGSAKDERQNLIAGSSSP
eukprot:gene5926-19481_t